MIEKPTTDDSLVRARLREVANDLTNGLIGRLHDILEHTAQENLQGARESGLTMVNVMEATAVLRTVNGYAYMASRRLQQIASLMQLGEGVGDEAQYLALCDREGPCCDCEAVCKHKPKRLHCTERTKDGIMES